ncbi:MAG: cation-transporting P-type ATPase [Patescibacteria group bacterium]
MEWRKGLSEEEARQARLRYGRNEVRVDEGKVWLRILINQLRSPLVYVLLIASGVSFLLANWVDAGVILAAVLINTFFGFALEYKAEKSMEALAKLLTPRARVKRGDEWKEIDATLLAPGDVVKLTIGWRAPADGLLIVEDDMYLNEAILTGESMPMIKKSWQPTDTFTLDNGAFDEIGSDYKGFTGTIVERGIGEMLVVKTGAGTKIGGIAKVTREKGADRTPLQKRLDRLVGYLTLVVSAIAGMVFIYGLLTGKSFLEFLNTSAALAVSAIPEGLVVGLTVILAVGMKRILKKKAIVRGLVATETLGSVSVICLDKTGTITEGKMTAVGAVTDLKEEVDEQIADEGKHDPARMKWLIEIALLCNDLRDPLDISMRDWAVLRLEKRVGLHAISEFTRIDEIPFDHKFKYVVTRHVTGAGEVVEFISGAPEVVLSLSKFKTAAERKKWLERFAELGIRGYRMVAIGMKKLNAVDGKKKIIRAEVRDYEWLGLVLFTDPVRDGVAESLRRAISAGMKLKVITGDYKETAWAVVREAGLVEGFAVDEKLVMTGDEFTTLAPAEKKGKIIDAVLFARTSPEQKLFIVETLQKEGETVAMMGDGVNDVPALKRADIGIVVDSASDLAREVSDLILLDNNFMTILSAVEEGRGIFDNLRKVILFLLSDSFAAIVVVVVSIYFGWPLPLLASQILWINLISDCFPYIALTVEPKEKDLLSRRPIARNEPILEPKRIALIAVISLTAGVLALFVFWFSYFVAGYDLVYARTLAFTMQGISSLVYVFSSRSLSRPIWKENFFKNPFLNLGVFGGLALQALAIYWRPLQTIFETVAISITEWGYLFLGGLLLIATVETVKSLFFRNGD